MKPVFGSEHTTLPSNKAPLKSTDTYEYMNIYEFVYLNARRFDSEDLS